MTDAAFQVQGWCPGALRPMMSGDGLVVRVRAPLVALTPQAQAELQNAWRALKIDATQA